MDSFEFNKIAAGILISLLVAMVGSLISETLVHPHKLEKNVFIVEGVEASSAQGDSAKDEPLKPIGPMLASANIENGKVIAKKCIQCHTFEKDGANKTGPNLWGVVGNKIAHMASYAYSSGFKAKDGKWDYETLNQYLHKPRTFIPGTKMSFAGLANEQERADVIAYMRSLSDSPEPLPNG
jgi:cytochrome c